MCRIWYIIVLFLFISCINTEKGRTLSLLQAWNGREIIYSPGMKFTMQGLDTLSFDFTQCRYKIVTYVDSIGCVSCKLDLQKWSRFASEIDSICPNDVCFQFVFQPYKVNELLLLLKQNKFALPVFIDIQNQFGKLNDFPKEIEFHTFLLNKDNKVIAIGNPTFSSQMKDFYLKIIRGEEVQFDNSESSVVKTNIQIKEQITSLGHFNWQQEQDVVFIIQNIGKQSLVIKDVITSCGCTTINYSKEPVRPGNCVELKIRYKADRPEHFDKTITVYCNAETSPIKLRITGNAE